MLGPETTRFLEGGCALIIATVSPDGAPHATRGWGLTVLDSDRATVRILLDASDDTALEHLESEGAIAITGADVRTLRSMQVKGRSTGLEAGTEGDHEVATTYCDAFFGDIVATDGTPRRLLERIRPAELTACSVTLDEVFDQTPGPDAGARLPGSRP